MLQPTLRGHREVPGTSESPSTQCVLEPCLHLEIRKLWPCLSQPRIPSTRVYAWPPKGPSPIPRPPWAASDIPESLTHAYGNDKLLPKASVSHPLVTPALIQETKLSQVH